jgi:hypothetical protein
MMGYPKMCLSGFNFAFYNNLPQFKGIVELPVLN